jgi:hypothetical protein
MKMKSPAWTSTSAPSTLQPSVRLSTPDLYLAAFLKAKGAFLLSADWHDTRLFSLFEGNRLAELRREYVNDAPVGALAFKAALAELRALIFSRGHGA